MHTHTHPAGELLPEAWASLDELLLHMSDGHRMLIGPVGKTLGQVAQIHSEEHKLAVMTTGKRVAANLASFRSRPGARQGECGDCGSEEALYDDEAGESFCPACAWGAS